MENNYAGMTVNERLYVIGLMEEFDRAVEEKNVDRVYEILAKVGLNEESTKPILQRLQLSNGSNNDNERFKSLGDDGE
jgi:predicted AAA+ superfamily ATPase